MISIIVPVYNAQKYIKRCVESIVNQSYQKWELILIDDGSKDDSSLICDEFKQTDSRIHVIHTVNQGASAARNRGLDEAAGDYITFVDADDWVETNHLEVLLNQINSDIDLCINSFIADLYYGPRPYQYKTIKTHDNIESINSFFTLLLQHSQFLWNKLFKSSIIKDNHIRFNTSISLGEDNIFILEYLNYIKGLSSSSICTYHYDQIDENPFSLGRRKRSVDAITYQLKNNCEAILKLYDKYNIELLYEYASDYFYTRIFERIFVPNIDVKCCLADLPVAPLKYFEDLSQLKVESISNSYIRSFWKGLLDGKKLTAKFYLNIYLLKLWLKTKIIKIVVAVKHAFRNAQRNAFL